MAEQPRVCNEEIPTSSVETLVEQCLPGLRRWAHGRLPRAARGQHDTTDLIQEAAVRMLERRDRFTPRHSGAVQRYMRLTVLNLVRDEARRIASRPPVEDLDDEPPCHRTGPLLHTIREERRAHYERRLAELRPKDRHLVSARVEQGLSIEQIVKAFGFPSPAAARMAVGRALGQLMRKLA